MGGGEPFTQQLAAVCSATGGLLQSSAGFTTASRHGGLAHAQCTRVDGAKGGLRMGERAKGKDKGKLKKKPKAVKPGVRPHEQPRPGPDLLKRDE